MARNFEVGKTKVADNLTDAQIATAIETFLDNLSIGSSHTVYEISIYHKSGFIHCICVYEP